MKPLHLFIACGGTGGHFYPTMAIARAFKESGNRVTLLISGAHADEQLALARENALDALPSEAERLPSSRNPFRLLAFAYRFLRNALHARRQLQELKADILLGMGSYASLPACILKPASIRLFLHEGNAFMGKANRILLRKATAIGLSLPLRNPAQLKGCPHTIVGMPLRDALLTAAANDASARQLASDYLKEAGLQPGKTTLLVFGGSQGAQFINTLLLQAAPLLSGKGVQIIHLTGTQDNDALRQAYAAAGIPACVRASESHIEKCYLASSLVICRGGASTLCELALFSKPAIILPLPSAADDHQTCNALLASSLGGAIHLPQSQATPQSLIQQVLPLLENPEKLAAMGKAIHALAQPDAAHNMVRLILDSAK